MNMAQNDSDFVTLSLLPIWCQTNSTTASLPLEPVEAPPRQVLWLLGGQEPRLEEINHRPTPFLFHNLLSLNSNPNPNPGPLAGPRLGELRHDFHSDAVPPLKLNPTPNPNPNPRPLAGPIRRRRSSASRRIRDGKSEAIPTKFAWVTSRRARVKSLAELSEIGIKKVGGEVKCTKCEKTFSMEIEIGERFSALRDFVAEKWENMRDRSAPEWDTPAMVDCRECGARESAKGVVAEKKKEINWLFLLLGGFLCCCSLEQLKYFCKHTGNHRTGAKNRVLYLTYLALCKQLDPSGPFDAL